VTENRIVYKILARIFKGRGHWQDVSVDVRIC